MRILMHTSYSHLVIWLHAMPFTALRIFCFSMSWSPIVSNFYPTFIKYNQIWDHQCSKKDSLQYFPRQLESYSVVYNYYLFYLKLKYFVAEIIFIFVLSRIYETNQQCWSLVKVVSNNTPLCHKRKTIDRIGILNVYMSVLGIRTYVLFTWS